MCQLKRKFPNIVWTENQGLAVLVRKPAEQKLISAGEQVHKLVNEANKLRAILGKAAATARGKAKQSSVHDPEN